MRLDGTRPSAAFYRTVAFLPLIALLILIRYFVPNASGKLWDAALYLTLGWCVVVSLLALYRVLRSR
jgi:hypothetical protein